MKEEVKEYVVKTITNNYYNLLLTAYDEERRKFFVTLTVIDFITKLREKNINYNLNDIFIDTFLELLDDEANTYINDN